MNWANYHEVLQQMQAAGLLVDDIEVVGRFKRCRVDGGDREKRGWYQLHELRMETTGAVLLVGSYGVWSGNDHNRIKIELPKGSPTTPEQRAALRQSLAADRKAADAARQADAARAANQARRVYALCTPDVESDYLRDKKVTAAPDVRGGPAGELVIPLRDASSCIHALQIIYPAGHRKAKRLQCTKLFWPAGCSVQSRFFLFGKPAAGGVCLLVEGWATGASLHQATGLPVLVAFSANNLLPVANAAKKRWPGLRLLVCADDDRVSKCKACGKPTHNDPKLACTHCHQPHGGRNAGRAAAEDVVTALGAAAHVALPMFDDPLPTDSKGPTDFNDLHVLEGLARVREQIEDHLKRLAWNTPPARPPASPADDAARAAKRVETIDEMLARFIYIYPTKNSFFDVALHELVDGEAVAKCASRRLFREFMEHPERPQVLIDQVGFDPSGQDRSTLCNLWAGWPTKPASGRCEKLLMLGEHLCSGDAALAPEVWAWLLKWLAYPIQHPGAKMRTAVVMHGPQGTGKNLFFEAVLAIYDRYGAVVDQDAIEDRYNDYLSRKLMLLADEVVARQEMFHAKNKLKGQVTGDWLRINPKFVASYRERNHINLIFLSNEVMPMALERDDRRYAVIWTPGKLQPSFYAEVRAEIDEGGIAALNHHLLHLHLGDFGPHTPPPMTQAKTELIELGLDSSERFYQDWINRHVPLPLTVARTEDLYVAYRLWAGLQGVHKPTQQATFISTVSKRPGASKARRHHFKGYSRTLSTQSFFITPPGAPVPDDKEDFTDELNKFAEAVDHWREEGARTTRRHGTAPQAPGSDDGN